MTAAHFKAQSNTSQDQTWVAHYLRSVVSEQRMYEACVNAVRLACLKSVISGNLALPNISNNPSHDRLNLIQSRAVDSFVF